MLGSLALVGSGEFLPIMADFEKSLIDDGVKNGKAPLYVQIPTAAGQESPERLHYWENLGRTQAELMKVEPHFLPIFNRNDAHNPEFVNLINNSALMYMSGGDPHYLAETLIDTPVWKAIENNWRTGASLAGCSAGAMAMSAHIPNFRFTKREPTLGFNLLPDIRVIPHFNKFFRWIPDSAAKVLLHAPNDTIVIGIDELTALVKRSGHNNWLVHGEAKVHILQGQPKQELLHGETYVVRLEEP
jgi:cyanophycinase-like exopeptidase